MSVTGLSVSPSLSSGGFTTPVRPVAPAVDAAAKARAAASAQAKQQLRDDIREKGLHGWAQEQKLEALKEKIRRQILAERDLTEAKLAALDPKGDGDVSKSIEEEISRRVQSVMRGAMEDQLAKSGKDKDRSSAPMIVDLSV